VAITAVSSAHMEQTASRVSDITADRVQANAAVTADRRGTSIVISEDCLHAFYSQFAERLADQFPHPIQTGARIRSAPFSYRANSFVM
jgi:hypothetical protein